MAASAARAVASDWPMRSHMKYIRVPHEPTSGSDQKAISDSLKFEARFVAHSEIEIKTKKTMAVPTKGKGQKISSRH